MFLGVREEREGGKEGGGRIMHHAFSLGSMDDPIGSPDMNGSLLTSE